MSNYTNSMERFLFFAEKGRLTKIFRLLRTFKGVKIRDVSKAVGLTELTIQNIEAGKSKPQLSSLIKLLEYYEISFEKIIAMADNTIDGNAYWIEYITTYLNTEN